MQQEKSQSLSKKSRSLLYHFKKSLQAQGILLDTHICNMFEYRKEKFKKKDFHKLIRNYNKNLVQSQIDQLFEELDDSNNGFVFYQYLMSAYDSISELDNPAQELNRRSKILSSPSKKKQMDILIQIKDLLLQTEDYISVIQIFITEKDGFMTRQNLVELMNNFDYKDKSKQKIVLESLFGEKHKIQFGDLLVALNLDHDATKINLSEMDIEESVVLDDLQKSQFIKLQMQENKKRQVMEQSRILDSLNGVVHSGVYSIQKIPQVLAPYFNYGSELQENFALLASELIANKHFFIDHQNPTYAKAAGWVHISQLRGDYHLFHAAQSVLQRDTTRKGLGAMLQPKDIIQGGFGDCYFLSAVAAIVQDYPQLVYRLFVLQKNPSHIFGVRLFIDGIWKTITLDGCFPINHYGALCGAQPHHNDIWVMLLEKAWAKVYKSFQNIHSGFNQEGLLAISGAPSISLSSRQNNFLNRIQVQFGKGSIITCATSKDVNQLTNAEQQNLGIFAAHAYTIMKVYKDLPFRDSTITLLKIRNPWGKKGWKGDWSYSSPIWTNSLREKLNFKNDPKDGTFFMSLGDFVIYFDHINISKVNLGHRNSHVTIEGNRFNFYQNRVVIKTRGDYFFTIYQENPRKYKNSSGVVQKSKSWLFLAQVQKYNEQGKIASIKSIASSAKNHKDNTIQTTLQPGVYVILSNVSWGYWDSHQYTITSYGPDKVDFSGAEIASELMVGQFIENYSEKIVSLGGCTTTIYPGTNISKSYYFNHHEGLGFISITNEDSRIIEVKIRLQPCVGITLLAPYSMPLILMVMPFQKVTTSFLVDPQGYNYKMHQTHRLYAVGT